LAVLVTVYRFVQ